MLFDTDLNTIYLWDGAAWKTSAQVAGGPKLNYPYADTVVTPTGTVDLFAIRYNAAENKRVVRLENNNSSNGSSTLSVANAGVGVAGFFTSTNPATAASTVYATTASNAGGALAPVAVYGESTGTGSLGGAFWNQNAANGYPALYAKTLGTGSAIFGETSTGIASVTGKTDGPGNAGYFEATGNGSAGMFTINNPANDSDGIFVTTNGTGAGVATLNSGTGRAGYFEVNNAASTSPAFTVTTNVSGSVNGFESFHTGVGDAIFANATSGSAGNFHNTNSASVYSTVYSQTNATGSHALGLNNSANGNALTIFGGGARVSTAVLSAGTTITTRSVAYRITGGGPFTFSIPGYTFSDGDTMFIYNDTGGAVTVEGLQLVAGEGKTFIYFAGVGFRAF